MEVDSTNFFQQLPVPDKFTEKNDKICNFVSKHNEIGNKVVLVTVRIYFLFLLFVLFDSFMLFFPTIFCSLM